MAHEKVHVICENLCLEEGMTKAEIESRFATKQSVEGLASGSPKGVYASINALKTANPDTGVYIVSADGHIYSWTKNSTSDPVDLGVYQAAEDSETVSIIKENVIQLGDELGYIFPTWLKQRISSSGVISNSDKYILTDGFLNNIGEIVNITINNSLVHGIVTYYYSDGSFYKKSSAFTGSTQLLPQYKAKLELYYDTTATVITSHIVECIEATKITIDGKRIDDKIENINDNIEEINNDIEEINDRIDNIGVNIIPDYWQSEIDSKVNEIKSLIYNQGEKTNVSAFMISSDNHYNSNSGVSPKLMKYIQEKLSINLHVNCGDLIEDTSTHDGNLTRIKTAMDNFINSTDKILSTQGNHDNGATVARNGVIAYSRLVTDTEWRMRTTNRITNQPNMKFYKNGKAFYYDDVVQKIRFISIDAFENREYTVVDGNITAQTFATMTDDQVEFIRSAFNNTPNDYSVITFSHIAIKGPIVNNQNIEIYNNTLNKSTNLLNIISTFKNDGGKYICHICGHLHHDFLTMTDGITEVNMLNDGTHYREASYWNSVASAETLQIIGNSPQKVLGTTNECAFDVCIINHDTQTVKLIRIGAGNDREFTY